jgi:pterin-4a-carbinolamine dehydratase
MRDFEAALAFIEQVSREAVDHERRPDMCIEEYNHVRITIANLHHAALTQAEHRLAAKVDAVIERHHPDAVLSR